MSDLSFLKNAIQQQKATQSNVTTQSQAKIPQPSSLTIQELTRIAQSQKEAQLRSNPNWFNKNNKRNIPGHLIKRSSIKLNQDQIEEDELDNLSSNLSSQANKKILSSFRKLQPQDHDSYVNDFTSGNEDLELPPKKSIYDLNYDDEDLTSSTDILKKNTTDLINKDPMNFRNAFNSNVRMGLTTNSHIASSKLSDTLVDQGSARDFGTQFVKDESIQENASTPKTQFATPSHPLHTQNNLQQQQQGLESAVLIFGYDDKSFGDILQHFSKFGTILEDFNMPIMSDISTSSAAASPFKSQKKTYPIFIGKSWVKLTYDNPSSAIRACRENELNVDNRHINIIPYSREVLEKFLDNKIDVKDDIGDSLNNLNFIKLDKIPAKFETLLHDTPIMDASKRNKDVMFNTSIKIKNGDNLFINTPKKPDAKDEPKKANGILKKASDMLFGFNDI